MEEDLNSPSVALITKRSTTTSERRQSYRNKVPRCSALSDTIQAHCYAVELRIRNRKEANSGRKTDKQGANSATMHQSHKSQHCHTERHVAGTRWARSKGTRLQRMEPVLCKLQYRDPGRSKILKEWELQAHQLAHSAKKEPQWEAEPVPVVRSDSCNVGNNNWENLETDDQCVCLYFALETGRPLTVFRLEGSVFHTSQLQIKGKRKK